MTAAILDVRLAARLGIVRPNGATINLVRMFGLDPLPVGRRPLICRWHVDADGRLVCTREPDIGLLRGLWRSCCAGCRPGADTGDAARC
jgi:hypothetical protein